MDYYIPKKDTIEYKILIHKPETSIDYKILKVIPGGNSYQLIIINPEKGTEKKKKEK